MDFQCVDYDGPQKPMPSGYFYIWDGERRIYAHRLAWEALFGPIPTGLTIDHLCFNKACINAFHMELVSRAENTRRGAFRRTPKRGARTTHCPKGHEYTDANTKVYRNKRDGCLIRHCRTCDAERHRSARLLHVASA